MYDLVGAYGIKEVDPETYGAMVCGTCGRAWDEDITPAGRCPFEYDHEYADYDEEVPMYRLREWDDETGDIRAEQMETHGIEELFVLTHDEGTAWIWATSRINAISILNDIVEN